MQAIILAAGMGRRLGEFTKNNTKCMVPVNGVKLIDRMLTQLAALHLQRVVIVVGYEGQRLRNYIGNRYDDVLRIEYVNNPVYDKTNNIYSLALAKEQLQEDDTLLIESDLISTHSIVPPPFSTTRAPIWPSWPSTKRGWTAPWSASTTIATL